MLKIEIHINRELMKDLGPYSFFVIAYYKAIYEKTGKIPSYNQATKDIGISYVKIRAALARVYSYLSNNKYKKYYKFLNSKSLEAYKTVKARNDRKRARGQTFKGDFEEKLWQYITKKIQPHFQLKVTTHFDWRTNQWVSNLLNHFGKNKKIIDAYIDWYIHNKIETIGKFNAGLFCCDSMLEEYLQNKKHNNEITRKKIKTKKSQFEAKAKRQNQKLLDKIIIKIQNKEELDKYDLENLENLKEEGFYVDYE